MQDHQFKDRVAIVCGASRGIGSVVASMLAAQGASVVISSRKVEGLEAAARAIGADAPGRVHPIAADAARTDDLQRLVDGTMAKFGRIDHVVYNAGASPHFGPLLDSPVDAWQRGFQVNVLGALTLIQGAVKAWMGEHGGSIVTVATLGALQPRTNTGVYNTTKAGLVMLTRQFAVELGPKIRVNAVAPGLVKTDFSQAMWSDPDRLAMVLKENPLGRLGTPEEVASTIVFLLSEAAGFINGQTVTIDGGAGKGR